MKRDGDRTIYEWKINLGDLITPGKTIGFDYVVFDKDQNMDSRQISWGRLDGPRHLNHEALGDLVLLDHSQPLAELEGKMYKNDGEISELPDYIQFAAVHNDRLWVKAQLDTSGNYRLQLPEGTYNASIPRKLITKSDVAFILGGKDTLIEVHAGKITRAIHHAVKFPGPDLVPQRGILHEFDEKKAGLLDEFINQYREFYGIPGVSLALIRDGKVTYHKTYGWQNSSAGNQLLKTHCLKPRPLPNRSFPLSSCDWLKRGSSI
jgi:hypothetical protein